MELVVRSIASLAAFFETTCPNHAEMEELKLVIYCTDLYRWGRWRMEERKKRMPGMFSISDSRMYTSLVFGIGPLVVAKHEEFRELCENLQNRNTTETVSTKIWECLDETHLPSSKECQLKCTKRPACIQYELTAHTLSGYKCLTFDAYEGDKYYMDSITVVYNKGMRRAMRNLLRMLFGRLDEKAEVGWSKLAWIEPPEIQATRIGLRRNHISHNIVGIIIEKLFRRRHLFW